MQTRSPVQRRQGRGRAGSTDEQPPALKPRVLVTTAEESVVKRQHAPDASRSGGGGSSILSRNANTSTTGNMMRDHPQEAGEPVYDRVRVHCRVRPMLPSDRSGQRTHLQIQHHVSLRAEDSGGQGRGRRGTSSSSSSASSPKKGKTARQDSIVCRTKAYYFDSVLGGDASNRDMYRQVAEPVCQSVLNGYNGTILAYGQTGTGKTYTLFSGSDGVIPVSVTKLFENASRDGSVTYLSVVELYMELVLDLLAGGSYGSAWMDQGTSSGAGQMGSGGQLSEVRIREDPRDGIILENCEQVRVHNSEACMRLIRDAEHRRAEAPTLANKNSSRSHAVVILKREIRNETADGCVVSRFHIVDLAGSERVKKTNAWGLRLGEARRINLSLSALGNCIAALTDVTCSHIPFRDSKLTRLLQDSLGGTAKTALIVTVSPLERDLEETQSTLDFGSRAMRVQNRPKIHQVTDYRTLAMRLQSELDKKEDEISKLLLRRSVAGSASLGPSAAATPLTAGAGGGGAEGSCCQRALAKVETEFASYLEEFEKQAGETDGEILKLRGQVRDLSDRERDVKRLQGEFEEKCLDLENELTKRDEVLSKIDTMVRSASGNKGSSAKGLKDHRDKRTGVSLTDPFGPSPSRRGPTAKKGSASRAKGVGGFSFADCIDDDDVNPLEDGDEDPERSSSSSAVDASSVSSSTEEANLLALCDNSASAGVGEPGRAKLLQRVESLCEFKRTAVAELETLTRRENVARKKLEDMQRRGMVLSAASLSLKDAGGRGGCSPKDHAENHINAHSSTTAGHGDNVHPKAQELAVAEKKIRTLEREAQELRDALSESSARLKSQELALQSEVSELRAEVTEVRAAKEELTSAERTLRLEVLELREARAEWDSERRHLKKDAELKEAELAAERQLLVTKADNEREALRQQAAAREAETSAKQAALQAESVRKAEETFTQQRTELERQLAESEARCRETSAKLSEKVALMEKYERNIGAQLQELESTYEKRGADAAGRHAAEAEQLRAEVRSLQAEREQALLVMEQQHASARAEERRRGAEDIERALADLRLELDEKALTHETLLRQELQSEYEKTLLRQERELKADFDLHLESKERKWQEGLEDAVRSTQASLETEHATAISAAIANTETRERAAAEAALEKAQREWEHSKLSLRERELAAEHAAEMERLAEQQAVELKSAGRAAAERLQEKVEEYERRLQKTNEAHCLELERTKEFLREERVAEIRDLEQESTRREAKLRAQLVLPLQEESALLEEQGREKATRIRELEHAVNAASAEAESLRVDNKGLGERVRQLETDVETHTDRCRELDAHVAETESVLLEERRRADSVQEKMRHLENRLATAGTEGKELADELHRLAQEREASAEEKSALEERARDQQTELARLRVELEDQRLVHGELENDIANHKQKEAALFDTLSECRMKRRKTASNKQKKTAGNTFVEDAPLGTSTWMSASSIHAVLDSDTEQDERNPKKKSTSSEEAPQHTLEDVEAELRCLMGVEDDLKQRLADSEQRLAEVETRARESEKGRAESEAMVRELEDLQVLQLDKIQALSAQREDEEQAVAAQRLALEQSSARRLEEAEAALQREKAECERRLREAEEKAAATVRQLEDAAAEAQLAARQREEVVEREKSDLVGEKTHLELSLAQVSSERQDLAARVAEAEAQCAAALTDRKFEDDTRVTTLKADLEQLRETHAKESAQLRQQLLDEVQRHQSAEKQAVERAREQERSEALVRAEDAEKQHAVALQTIEAEWRERLQEERLALREEVQGASEAVLKQEVSVLNEEHEEEVAALKAEITTAERECDRLTRDLAEQEGRLESQFQTKLLELEKCRDEELEAERQRLSETSRTALEDCEQKAVAALETAMEKQREEAEEREKILLQERTDLVAKAEEHEERVATLQKMLDTHASQLEEQKTSLLAEHASARDALAREHEQAVSMLEARYEAEVATLREEVRATTLMLEERHQASNDTAASTEKELESTKKLLQEVEGELAAQVASYEKKLVAEREDWQSKLAAQFKEGEDHLASQKQEWESQKQEWESQEQEWEQKLSAAQKIQEKQDGAELAHLREKYSLELRQRKHDRGLREEAESRLATAQAQVRELERKLDEQKSAMDAQATAQAQQQEVALLQVRAELAQTQSEKQAAFSSQLADLQQEHELQRRKLEQACEEKKAECESLVKELERESKALLETSTRVFQEQQEALQEKEAACESKILKQTNTIAQLEEEMQSRTEELERTRTRLHELTEHAEASQMQMRREAEESAGLQREAEREAVAQKLTKLEAKIGELESEVSRRGDLLQLQAENAEKYSRTESEFREKAEICERLRERAREAEQQLERWRDQKAVEEADIKAKTEETKTLKAKVETLSQEQERSALEVQRVREEERRRRAEELEARQRELTDAWEQIVALQEAAMSREQEVRALEEKAALRGQDADTRAREKGLLDRENEVLRSEVATLKAYNADLATERLNAEKRLTERSLETLDRSEHESIMLREQKDSLRRHVERLECDLTEARRLRTSERSAKDADLEGLRLELDESRKSLQEVRSEASKKESLLWEYRKKLRKSACAIDALDERCKEYETQMTTLQEECSCLRSKITALESAHASEVEGLRTESELTREKLRRDHDCAVKLLKEELGRAEASREQLEDKWARAADSKRTVEVELRATKRELGRFQADNLVYEEDHAHADGGEPTNKNRHVLVRVGAGPATSSTATGGPALATTKAKVEPSSSTSSSTSPALVSPDRMFGKERYSDLLIDNIASPARRRRRNKGSLGEQEGEDRSSTSPRTIKETKEQTDTDQLVEKTEINDRVVDKNHNHDTSSEPMRVGKSALYRVTRSVSPAPPVVAEATRSSVEIARRQASTSTSSRVEQSRSCSVDINKVSGSDINKVSSFESRRAASSSSGRIEPLVPSDVELSRKTARQRGNDSRNLKTLLHASNGHPLRELQDMYRDLDAAEVDTALSKTLEAIDKSYAAAFEENKPAPKASYALEKAVKRLKLAIKPTSQELP
ncbi:unnamed protein product [Amoebophrya sp. A25]|nr:unnamed protein product [Amoebophrya sp. A25]|eukprot:GSA25T00022506001.1